MLPEEWLERSFSQDTGDGVYVSKKQNGDFPYSDGEDVESRLLAAIRAADDRSVGSPELTRAIQDFASRYHLSSERANLFRPLGHLFRGRVLVVGAGCGADARYIGETGAEVWAIEGSRRRAGICAERCRDLPNVSVFCARMEEFEPPVKFDVITLVGVLEYSPLLLGSSDGPARLLRLCARLLETGGALVVAIENLLGLKYFAGAPEDHIGVPFANMNGMSPADRPHPVTFGRAELSGLLAAAGLPAVEFLYPFPDYKFPHAIVHPAAEQEMGEGLGEILSGFAVAEGSLPFERTFSEEVCWPAIARNALVGDLANSFLAIARTAPGEALNPRHLVYLYADQRRRAFAKETIVEKSAGEVILRRRRLYPSAAPVGPYRQTIEDHKWAPGRLLASELMAIVNRPGWSVADVVVWGHGWVEFLRAMAVAPVSPNPLEHQLPPGFVDCVPSNLIVDRDGRLVPIDQEWTAPAPVPLPFVLFRGLFGLLFQLQSIEAPAPGVPPTIALLCRHALQAWGYAVSEELMEEMAGRECVLQEAVSGLAGNPSVYLNAPLPPVRRDHRLLASLTHFDNGVTIPQIARERHASADSRLRLSWSGSPASTAFGSFYAWLNAPADAPAQEGYVDLGITNLAAYIYSRRPDVRSAFPDLTSQDRPSFTEWLLHSARVEYQLDDAFLKETESALRRWSQRRARETECAATHARLDELARRAEAAESEAAGLRQRITALEEDLQTAVNNLAQARASEAAARLEAEKKRVASREKLLQAGLDLRKANQRIAALETAARRYVQAFEHSFEGYRVQRAWKLMLEARRAYTMAVRGGWRGGLRWITGPRPPLEDFELSFPLLPNYLPAPSDTSAGMAPFETGEDVPAPRRYDVVILAIVDFDFRFQRPQQLAAQFARNGHRVFWISATRALPADSPNAYRAVPLRDGIWDVHLRAPHCDPYTSPLSDKAAGAFHQSLELFYREWGVSENVVMAQLPFWRRLALQARRLPGSVLLYDCMDDWDTFENLGDFNRSEERRLAAECDILSVTAAKLVDKFTERGLQPVLVRNGSDYDFFAAGAEPLRELEGVSRPVIGYFGAIADWIDLDLVYEVAKARPGYSFVLAGQAFNRDTSALEALPNVRLLGARPYDHMPRLLTSFDVCVIPFLLNQVTHATDPVKLYEYLAQGKPVVATDMSELRGWSDLLYLARGAQQFAGQLDAAVAENDPELRARRVEFARKNSWRARVSLMDETIRGRFPKVSLLIVSYNSAEYLEPCLRAVLADTPYPNFEVIVLDNASTDSSAEIAERFAAFDPRVRVVRSSVNRGFAGGNNEAARLASGEHVVFLNADAMVAPGWLTSLLRHFSLDPSIGLLCPVTNFAGNEAKINIDYEDEAGMRRFAWRLARQNPAAAIDVAVVPLYCALMRRDVFFELGGLDEGYRIGMFEDDDLSEAVRRRGLRVCVAEDAFVHHFGQGSFSKLDPHEYNRIFEENRRRYESKWQKTWVAHKTRPNVRPAHEEPRFVPAQFCDPDLFPVVASVSA